MAASKMTPKQSFANYNENPSYANANVAMLGIACDISCTYGKGAWHGPSAFLDASFQLEHETPATGKSFHEMVRVHNLGVIESLREVPKAKQKHYLFQETKKISEEMVKATEEKATKVLQDKKLLMTIGGDHSISNGVLHALAKTHGAENVTIVHFDAHLDLRDAHEALDYSHASVMFNARKMGFPMVQIGIRDHISEEEIEYIQKNKIQKSIYWCPSQPKGFYDSHKSKLSTFLDTSLILWDSKPSEKQMQSIFSQIKTKYVYLSIDMDVMDASLVPSTGTPLPRGLSFETLQDISHAVIQHAKNKKISLIGFDVVEIAPLLRDPKKEYSPENVISPLVEFYAAHLAYDMLVWHFL